MSRFVKEFNRLIKSIDKKFCGQAIIKDYDADNMNCFIVELSPNSGPYKHGKFLFQVHASEHYPDSAPDVVCLTDIYHPNIDADLSLEHNICLNLFDEWSRTFGIEDCLQGLLFLLYHPNISDPVSGYFDCSLDYATFLRNVSRSLRGEEVDGFSFEKNHGWAEFEATQESEAAAWGHAASAVAAAAVAVTVSKVPSQGDAVAETAESRTSAEVNQMVSEENQAIDEENRVFDGEKRMDSEEVRADGEVNGVDNAINDENQAHKSDGKQADVPAAEESWLDSGRPDTSDSLSLASDCIHELLMQLNVGEAADGDADGAGGGSGGEAAAQPLDFVCRRFRPAPDTTDEDDEDDDDISECSEEDDVDDSSCDFDDDDEEEEEDEDGLDSFVAGSIRHRRHGRRRQLLVRRVNPGPDGVFVCSAASLPITVRVRCGTSRQLLQMYPSSRYPGAVCVFLNGRLLQPGWARLLCRRVASEFARAGHVWLGGGATPMTVGGGADLVSCLICVLSRQLFLPRLL